MAFHGENMIKNDKPIFKYFRGKWKEVGNEKEENLADRPTIKSEFIIKDYSTKSVTELEDLLHRQKKLVDNKAFISKLKDKGKKLHEKYEELQSALEIARRVNESNEECNLTNGTTLITDDINHLEWGGSRGADGEASFDHRVPKGIQIDIPEDESNPLQLLARHSVEYPPKQKISKANVENSPSVETILEELKRLDIASEDKEHTLSTLPSKDEVSQNYKPAAQELNNVPDTIHRSLKQKELIAKEKFKPNRPLATGKSEAWNKITSTSSKILTFEESSRLLAEANLNTKIKLTKEAEAALGKMKHTDHTSSVAQYLNYRDTNASHHVLEEFDEENEIIEDDLFLNDRLSDEEEDD